MYQLHQGCWGKIWKIESVVGVFKSDLNLFFIIIINYNHCYHCPHDHDHCYHHHPHDDHQTQWACGCLWHWEPAPEPRMDIMANIEKLDHHHHGHHHHHSHHHGHHHGHHLWALIHKTPYLHKCVVTLCQKCMFSSRNRENNFQAKYFGNWFVEIKYFGISWLFFRILDWEKL